MTDFLMNDILRSFRKMRMNKTSSQHSTPSSLHQTQRQPPQNLLNYQQLLQQQLQQDYQPVAQQTKDLKKIIKIIKKNVIKQKITRKMKIVV
ncbi:uncharacterized protein LOC115626395 [Scaptodrosophila lebanonensis]|uniref:Uncharacterized protein LOC115626395 n=1 Tax=Drosophila lebanonensis TaxID=7225 RepID=A0A6J2TR80_DROLE|nr:uncharacterized protein LOC115626395 [Scaptodrosophila lebanonensis]